MIITEDKFEHYKAKCPVVCVCISCNFNSCPVVFWINKMEVKE